jgi:hypothetical protein
MEVYMFIVIVSFPPIQVGKEADFLEWFASSNHAFSGFSGFVRRRLLKPVEGGTYAAIVEFETETPSGPCTAAPFTTYSEKGSCRSSMADLHQRSTRW